MEPIGQDAIFDEGGFLGGGTLAVVFIVTRFTHKGAVVYDGKGVASKPLADDHNIAQIGIFINKIGLAQMAKCLVDKNPAEFRIDNNRVFTALYRRCRQLVDCTLGNNLGFMLQILDVAEAAQITHGVVRLLHVHPVPCHSKE